MASIEKEAVDANAVNFPTFGFRIGAAVPVGVLAIYDVLPTVYDFNKNQRYLHVQCY